VVFTGDLATRSAEGIFTLVARRDNLIKSMGFRVGPDEVVAALLASGQVSEAAVTGIPDPDRSEIILAFVVLKHDGNPRLLKRYVNAELPSYMVPSRIEFLDSLPLLHSGKVDIAALRSGYVNQTLPRANS
jgi:acetyl-CoA synthetase